MDTLGDTFEFQDIDITNPKCVTGMTYARRRSLVIVTIADPQIQQVDFQKLMEKGMNVVRLKTSLYTTADRIRIISRIDKATKFLAKKHGVLNEWPCATCIELKTCITQTGLLEEDVNKILIDTNSEVTLTTDINLFESCNKNIIFIDYPYLTTDVKIGMELSITEDEIILVCTAKDEKSLKCTVTKGGYLVNMAYVCLRGCLRSHPYTLSKKDLQLLQFAVEYQVNMIIIEYPRKVDTILNIKKYFTHNLVKRPMLIAGISTQEGLMNLDDLIQEADGILLTREFLPYELEPALCNRMFCIQKYIAGKCIEAGKPFYISGEIYKETLLTGQICSREISDVTNAILQGASGFILNECNDIYNMSYAIKMMNEVCASVEPVCVDKTEFWHRVAQLKMPMNAAEASAMSCAVVANQTNARIIIIPTVSGRTAYLLNGLLPNSIIIGVSTKIKTVRLLKMYRSVVPLLYRGPPRRVWFNTVQARVTFALQYAVEQNWIDCGESYISLEKATEESSFCDAVRIWTVTENNKRTRIECPESYHDFDINTFAEPSLRRKKTLSSKMINETVAKTKVSKEEGTEEVTETDQKESKEENEKVKDEAEAETEKVEENL